MASDTKKRRLARKYGLNFPDLSEVAAEKDPVKRAKLWLPWIETQKELQNRAMEDKKLHWTRHRLFRWGHQWISTRDGRKWRELEASNDRIRKVINVIGPGLDFRLGVLNEQKPGWKYEPIPGMGVDGREAAEAQQSVVEWIFKTQKIWRLMTHAQYDAQTDGVSFLEVYVDRSRGPLIERYETLAPSDDRYHKMKAAGYERTEAGIRLPLGPGREVLSPGSSASTFRGGQIRTRRVMAAQTWCDPEAQTICGPEAPARWFLIQRPRDVRLARLETGKGDLEADDEVRVDSMFDQTLDGYTRWSGGLPPYPSNRMYLGQELVWDYTLYLAPDDEDIGPDGLYVRLLGEYEIKREKLPAKVIPVVRLPDGSGDPEMYPRPEMSDWISDQISVNALGSKILEYARMHSGAHLLAMKDTLIEQTWSAIVGSVTEYQGQKPDLLQPARVSPDLWQMFSETLRRLEDKMGFNDLAKGRVANVDSGFQDVSGRAVLGAREMFERQFGPMVRASADAATDWADIIVRYAQYLYTVPRLIPMAGRPDLAKRISNTELSGQPSVFVDPETLMPMPRALRNQMLIDHLKQGLIGPAEYKKRSPYAEVRDLTFGDTDQWNRAQWINTVLEERLDDLDGADAITLYSPDEGLGIYWQDNAEVHMQALEELIMDDRKPFVLRKIAADRWGIYSELQRSKSFPLEWEFQGMPRPPAPVEVLGVPNMVPQGTEPTPQARPSAPGQVPGTGGQPAASPAPSLSQPGPTAAATSAAAPLGGVRGDGLPR